MRILCYLSGGCRFTDKVHEELLPATKSHEYVRLYEIRRCKWCGDTHAVITSPEPEEVRNTFPRRYLDNGRPEVVLK